MDETRIALARACLAASHDGSVAFPEIVGRLIAGGFEGYTVDYRRETQTFYLPDGDSVVLDMPQVPGPVAATFDAAGVEAAVRWAQSGDPNYRFDAFSTRVKAAGCAGYIVSFPGRRVLYFGRTAETHLELFPQ